MYAEVSRVHRFIAHVEDVELNRYRAAPDVVRPEDNRDLRKQYLRGDIDERRLKEVLQMREKARSKNDAIHNVLRTVVDVGRDLFRDVMMNKEAGEPVERARAVMEQMGALAGYCNGALAGVARRYSCVVPQIEEPAWIVPLQTRSLGQLSAAPAPAAPAPAAPAPAAPAQAAGSA